MNQVKRFPLMWLAVTFGGATIVGYALQIFRSQSGLPPLIPPVTLTGTLLVLSGVLIALGVLLRRAVRSKSAKPVNPFHAVRLLAGARASQLVGALFAGCALGFLIQVLLRTVVPGGATWGPMLSLLISALLLTVAGVVVESLCRVPPEGGAPTDLEGAEQRSSGLGEAGTATRDPHVTPRTKLTSTTRTGVNRD